MNISDIPNFLVIIFFYMLAAAIAGAIPLIVIYRMYARQMKRYYESTGLNPYNIPYNFRKLIFMAKKWGIEDETQRQRIVKQATRKEKLELGKIVAGKDEFIHRWLNSFGHNALSPEAKAYAGMMKSIDEMNLFIQEPSNQEYSEELGLDYNTTSSKSIIGPTPIIGSRVRIIKLNSCISVPFLIASFIGYFILFGKLWYMLVPNGPNANGLVVINFLSGGGSIFTWGLIVGIAKLIHIPGIEIKT